MGAGTKQRHIAQQTHIRENRLSAIVQGWAEPRPEERQAIAEALGRSERGLFSNIEPDAVAIVVCGSGDKGQIRYHRMPSGLRLYEREDCERVARERAERLKAR